MKQTIKSRFDGRILYECEAETLLLAVQAAVSGGADLGGANLRGAYLGGADLGGAYLGGADLRGANLYAAYLGGADLGGADLRGAKINWQSHALTAELLLRAAGEDVDKRMVAGLIAVSTDWCWTKFLSLTHPLMPWALDELRKWVVDGDGAPEILKREEEIRHA